MTNPAHVRSARWLDGIAIAGSSLCILHCLALPLILAFLPALSKWLSLPEEFHLWFLLAALPLSGFVLWRHSLQRGKPIPFALGAAGLTTMAIALTFAGHWLEPVVTTSGGIMLAAAHVLNLRGRAEKHGSPDGWTHLSPAAGMPIPLSRRAQSIHRNQGKPAIQSKR